MPCNLWESIERDISGNFWHNKNQDINADDMSTRKLVIVSCFLATDEICLVRIISVHIIYLRERQK